MKYAGANWIERQHYGKNISELGGKVADLLGDLFLGIYHVDTKQLSKVEWNNEEYIDITLSKTLSTYDDDNLTRLVVLCHDRMLRCEVRAISYRYLRLTFSARSVREGRFYERHPTIEQAVDTVRKTS